MDLFDPKPMLEKMHGKSYFDKIAGSDLFVFLDEPQFKKREFQNRNRIKGPNGEVWLTVPVVNVPLTGATYHVATSLVSFQVRAR